MQTMAVGWLSLRRSNSAFVVGLVASIGALPIVLFSMHAGALVDRGDRLRIVQITQVVFFVQATVLWLVTLTGHVNIPMLLALQFVQGLASAVEIPARQSMVIQLVGRGDLQPAIALNSSGFNLARVVGPAIGGAVIAAAGYARLPVVAAAPVVAVAPLVRASGRPAAPSTAPPGPEPRAPEPCPPPQVRVPGSRSAPAHPHHPGHTRAPHRVFRELPLPRRGGLPWVMSCCGYLWLGLRGWD